MKTSRPYLFSLILYVFFLIGIVVLADLGAGGWVFSATALIPFGDKVCHLILMGIFSFLLNSAIRCQRISLVGIRFLVGSLIVCVVVLVEEISQFWVASRNVEAYDLLFDFVGIYLFGLLASLNLRMNTKKQDT